MKSWRGVPVLVSVLSGWVVACGPAPEGEWESGGAMDVVEVAPESNAAVDTETAKDALVSTGAWEVCDDAAQRVKDIHPTGSSAPGQLVDLNGRLIFVATDAEHGRELWVSKGKKTALLKDVNPHGHSAPRELTRVGHLVFFVADDGEHGPELWRTNGTEQGTVLVKDIHPDVGSAPEDFTVVDGALYFTANDGAHGRELWRTDGTERGTKLVHDFAPDQALYGLSRLTAWEDGLVLVHYASEAGQYHLMRVDKQGRVRRLFTSGPAGFSALEPAGRQLFFTVLDALDEADLWVTRETPGTARHVRHLPGDYPTRLTALSDVVYFEAGGEGFGVPGDPLHGAELWRSDGTPWGTWVVRDINPGPGSSAPSDLVVVDRTLYFAATGPGASGRELWRSDGTPWGTYQVADLNPGGGSDPAQLTEQDGWLFFSATTPGRGREVWYSNGRPWSTRPLMDIAAGARDASPRDFVRSGWEVYFAASDSTGDQELWSVPFRPMWTCGMR
jgi:ELWxxDGT repeat protein